MEQNVEPIQKEINTTIIICSNCGKERKYYSWEMVYEFTKNKKKYIFCSHDCRAKKRRELKEKEDKKIIKQNLQNEDFEDKTERYFADAPLIIRNIYNQGLGVGNQIILSNCISEETGKLFYDQLMLVLKQLIVFEKKTKKAKATYKKDLNE